MNTDTCAHTHHTYTWSTDTLDLYEDTAGMTCIHVYLSIYLVSQVGPCKKKRDGVRT